VLENMEIEQKGKETSEDKKVQQILRELDEEIQQQKNVEQTVKFKPSEVPIIDVHCHLGKDIDGRSQNEKEILENMQRFHVGLTVIFPFDTQPKDCFHEENIKVLDVMGKNDNIIGFARIDPHHENAVKEMQWASNMGLYGLKLHPRAQKFNINEIGFIFEEAEHLQIPIIIHSAHKTGLYQEQLKAILPSFTKTPIILAHAGLGDPRPVIEISQDQENVFLEISANHKHDIQLVILSAGPEKVMFGSDAPYQTVGVMLERMNIDWSDEESIEMVMYKNAATLLGLET
jgi:uncharacterized protein